MLDDLYPVTVDFGDDALRKARLFTRDGQVRVFTDLNRSGVTRYAEGAVLDRTALPGRRYRYTVEVDGDVQTWEVARTGGCGCGSRLKRFTATEAWA